MSVSRALISSFSAMTNHQIREDHLKLCFLWYDEVLVETIGSFDVGRLCKSLLEREGSARAVLHSLTDVIVSVDSRVPKEVVGDSLTRTEMGYPRWGPNLENYTYSEPENPEQFAHNCLLEHIAREHGVNRFTGMEVEWAEGRARCAVDAVLLWGRVNTELPCMLQTNGDEKLAMIAAQRFAAGRMPALAPLTLFEEAVPSLIGVPWAEVIRLRKDSSLKSLRERIGRITQEAGDDLDLARSLLSIAEDEAIDAIVENGRPRVTRVAIESILGNVPGLPVNPASVFLGIRQTAQEREKNKSLGWFYLLRDIRRGGQNGRNGEARGQPLF